jgi:putative ABC transport system ATP-binding protein
MITAKDLHRTYLLGAVEVRALRGVSFEIQNGDFVGVTGPSGSGKSTLLHLVGLLDTPTSGSITIDGIDILRLSDIERTRFRLNRLGFVFQEYALMQNLTALENVFLPSLARGMDMRDCVREGTEILKTMGLGERTGHLPTELSGGEQQRVAIARALVNKPDILFADEPCANLDTENSKVILDLFTDINRELGQTIVMVTHEPWHLPYCRRVMRLRDGIIESDEENREKDRPQSSGPKRQ